MGTHGRRPGMGSEQQAGPGVLTQEPEQGRAGSEGSPAVGLRPPAAPAHVPPLPNNRGSQGQKLARGRLLPQSPLNMDGLLRMRGGLHPAARQEAQRHPSPARRGEGRTGLQQPRPRPGLQTWVGHRRGRGIDRQRGLWLSCFGPRMLVLPRFCPVFARGLRGAQGRVLCEQRSLEGKGLFGSS